MTSTLHLAYQISVTAAEQLRNLLVMSHPGLQFLVTAFIARDRSADYASLLTVLDRVRSLVII